MDTGTASSRMIQVGFAGTDTVSVSQALVADVKGLKDLLSLEYYSVYTGSPL